MKKNEYLIVSEKFMSIQGEGQTMGVPAVFLRLAACNLMCGGRGTEKDKQLHNGATWRCDSIEVWQKGIKTAFKDVFDQEFISYLRKGAHLIITGGEPLLYQPAIVAFMDWFENNYFFMPTIEIETNGTLMPTKEMTDIVKYWNCSPKLSNSGEPQDKRFKPLVIDYLNGLSNIIFKFVISSANDYTEVINTYGTIVSLKNCVLMPAGENQELLNETREMVLDICKKYCIRFSDRLHIVAWNQKTGV
jgi:7-carboxy-7-deazaguanine synthase